MFLPEIVNGFQIVGSDELDFGEIDVTSFLSAVAGKGDQKPPGLFIGLPKVFGSEEAVELVKRDGGGGVGGEREGTGGCGGERGSGGGSGGGDGGGSWFEEESGGRGEGGGREVRVVGTAERVAERWQRVGSCHERERKRERKGLKLKNGKRGLGFLREFV